MKKMFMVLVLILAFGIGNGFSATTDHTENSKSDVELSVDNDIVKTVDFETNVSLEVEYFIASDSGDLITSVELFKFYNTNATLVEDVKNYNKRHRMRYRNSQDNFKNTQNLTKSLYLNSIYNPPGNLS